MKIKKGEERRPTMEQIVEEIVFRKLRVKMKNRAASLRHEARLQWNWDRVKYSELRARADKFDELSQMLSDAWDDKPVYPALATSVKTTKTTKTTKTSTGDAS